MVKKINEAEFSEVINSKLAVVDFNATWCGPCKMLGPVLEEVSEELAGKADFFVDRQVGFVPKPQLVEFINKSIG